MLKKHYKSIYFLECFFLICQIKFQNNWAVEDEYIALIIDWQGKPFSYSFLATPN